MKNSCPVITAGIQLPAASIQQSVNEQAPLPEQATPMETLKVRDPSLWHFKPFQPIHVPFIFIHMDTLVVY